ncbi:MAG: hypothetical protein IT426_10130 [Pirellulales bacterium]|nr:hypothetical protein [Pirellulales bacterium]
MSTFCIALMLFAVQPVAGNQTENQPQAAISQDSPPLADGEIAAAPNRRGKELEETARAALRRWVKIDKTNAPSAAREFLAVFDALKQDTTLPPATRRQLGGQVRNRLVRLAEMISRSNAAKRRNDSPPHLGNVRDAPQVLGQLGGGMNRPGGLGNQNRPAQRGGFGGNPANNFPPDAGEDLVALIQKTIAPASWDINGGPGSIYYWRPGRALVIRASEDVHEQIGGVLGQLHQGQ